MSVEPVVELLGVAVGVGADFAEHPFVEVGDRLHLDFAEDDDAVGVWGNEYAVDAKAGFFDFDGVEGVVFWVWGLVG